MESGKEDCRDIRRWLTVFEEHLPRRKPETYTEEDSEHEQGLYRQEGGALPWEYEPVPEPFENSILIIFLESVQKEAQNDSIQKPWKAEVDSIKHAEERE